LHKPFTDEVLIRKVREVLDGGKKIAAEVERVEEYAGTKITSGQ
jgi:hypothetical protein